MAPRGSLHTTCYARGMPRTHLHPLHRVTIGRTREVRGPDALERGFVGVIIAIAMTVAVMFSIHSVRMIQTLDAVTLASGAEIDAIIHRAVHGDWPRADDPNVLGRSVTGRYVTRMTLGDDGLITATLTLGPVHGFGSRHPSTIDATHGVLAFRPELLGMPEAPTIAFLCGYAKPVTGSAVTSSTNPTTLAEQDLPPFCR